MSNAIDEPVNESIIYSKSFDVFIIVLFAVEDVIDSFGENSSGTCIWYIIVKVCAEK